jgi:penicillin-binding protein 1A
MVTINAHTGEVVSMVGGYDFIPIVLITPRRVAANRFAYKPFIYTAAVEDGMTPDMLVSGAPIKTRRMAPDKLRRHAKSIRTSR